MGFARTEAGLVIPDGGLWRPGDAPDTFDERLGGAGVVDGDVGQFVTYDLLGDHTRRLELAVADELAGGLADPSITFCHRSGDGLAPLIGPALTAVAGGAPTDGIMTPWRDEQLADLTGSRCTVNQGYTVPIVACNPGAGEDVVIFFLGAPTRHGTRGVVFDMLATTGARVLLLWQAGLMEMMAFDAVGGSRIIDFPAHGGGGFALFTAIIDRSANVHALLNETAAVAAACPAGSMAQDQAGGFLQICPTGGSVGWGHQGVHQSIVILVGAGAADRWTAGGYAAVARVRRKVQGLLLAHGALPSYARAGLRSYYPLGPTGRVHSMNAQTPPCGHSECLGPDEEIVLFTGKNCCLVAGDEAAWSIDAGGAVALAAEAGADLVALEAAAPDAGVNVVDLNNPTGGTIYARVTAATASVARCHGSLRSRVVAGAPRLGWQTAAGAFSAIGDIVGGYSRTYGTAVPGAVTDCLAVQLPAGARCRVVLWQGGIGDRVPDEVHGLAAAATATQGVLTTTETPSNAIGTIEQEMVPRLWGGADPGAASITSMYGALACLYADGIGNVATADGVNVAQAALAEVDGTAERWRHAHGDRGLYVASVNDASEDLEAYDGALSGPIAIYGTWRAVRELLVLRNPRWRMTP